MRSAYFLAVRAVVNNEDPVGLIAMGAPDDEYEPEIEDLIKWREPATPEAVGEVFLRWFGSGAGDLTNESAARIASGINDIRRAHLPS